MKSLRFLALAGSGLILIGTLGLSLGCCSASPTQASPCDATPRNHVILIGQKLSCKEAHISKKQRQEVTWRSPDASNLEIVFADPTVFPKLHCPSSNVCQSGPAAPEARSERYEYTVWSTENGSRRSIDPGIIIHD